MQQNLKQLVRYSSSCQYISGPDCAQYHGLDRITQKGNLKHYFSMHIQIFADRLRTGNNSASELSRRYKGKKVKIRFKACRNADWVRRLGNLVISASHFSLLTDIYFTFQERQVCCSSLQLARNFPYKPSLPCPRDALWL